MTFKADWKRIKKDYERDRFINGENDVVPYPGEVCLFAGTYVADYSSQVRIGYLLGKWDDDCGFILPDNFYQDFNPLYWAEFDIKNPVEISIGVKR